jgi:hypothetical protein
MAYLLDSNVFIQAKNLHYGFDFCPAFWDWIDRAHAVGVVYSVDSVRAELLSQADELADWVRRRADGFFLAPNQATVPSLRSASTWANSEGYTPAAVAQAMAEQHTVVTHEIFSDSSRRIKIPNACLGLGIRYMTPFAMLRAEQAKFVIGPA